MSKELKILIVKFFEDDAFLRLDRCNPRFLQINYYMFV